MMMLQLVIACDSTRAANAVCCIHARGPSKKAGTRHTHACAVSLVTDGHVQDLAQAVEQQLTGRGTGSQ